MATLTQIHRARRIAQLFGDWRKAQAKFFAEGGIFDAIYRPGNSSARD